MAQDPIPPRVLLVMPAQWPRALLRAALRDAGYDAVGSGSLSTATRFPVNQPGRGPVRLVLIDQEALSAADAGDLEALLGRYPGAAGVLLASATRQVAEGPWVQVIRRPASVAEVMAALHALVPLPAQARHSID